VSWRENNGMGGNLSAAAALRCVDLARGLMASLFPRGDDATEGTCTHGEYRIERNISISSLRRARGSKGMYN
jgi:hypothetical protein